MEKGKLKTKKCSEDLILAKMEMKIIIVGA
jgi:hypothetical protein